MFTSTITINGRLAEDPTVLENLTEFVVLSNRRKPDEVGEWTNTDTSRFTIKTFRSLATKAVDLAKGDAVIIVGSIVTDTWTDTDSGQNRYKQVVLADAVGKSLSLAGEGPRGLSPPAEHTGMPAEQRGLYPPKRGPRRRMNTEKGDHHGHR